MATGIRDFRHNFFGTRPNRFKISGSFPTAITTDNVSNQPASDYCCRTLVWG